MSFAGLERAVMAELREVVNNRRLRNKDLLKWSTGQVDSEEGEVVVHLPRLGVNCAIAREHDKRQGEG